LGFLDLKWPSLPNPETLPLFSRKIGFDLLIPLGLPKIREGGLEIFSGNDVEGDCFCLNYSKKAPLGQTNEKKRFNFRYLFQALNDKIIRWGRFEICL